MWGLLMREYTTGRVWIYVPDAHQVIGADVDSGNNPYLLAYSTTLLETVFECTSSSMQHLLNTYEFLWVEFWVPEDIIEFALARSDTQHQQMVDALESALYGHYTSSQEELARSFIGANTSDPQYPQERQVAQDIQQIINHFGGQQ